MRARPGAIRCVRSFLLKEPLHCGARSWSKALIAAIGDTRGLIEAARRRRILPSSASWSRRQPSRKAFSLRINRARAVPESKLAASHHRFQDILQVLKIFEVDRG